MSIRADLADWNFETWNATQAFTAAGRRAAHDSSRSEFAALFRGRRLSIKAALLNQKLLTGVGNIYADESLFHAGIRPRRSAGRLTRAELERLRLALARFWNTLSGWAARRSPTTWMPTGVRGFFQLGALRLPADREPCRPCQTPIRRILLAGRGTHFCPKCQR